MPRLAEQLNHTAKNPGETEDLIGDPEFAAIKGRPKSELERCLNDQRDADVAQDSTKAIPAARQGNHKYGPFFKRSE